MGCRHTELQVWAQNFATEVRNLKRVATLLDGQQFQEWDVFQIAERMERVVTTFERIDENFKAVLNELDDDNRKTALTTQFDEADDLYVTVKARLKNRLKVLAPPVEPAAAVAAPAAAANPNPTTINFQLPVTQTARTWGYYSGDPLLWKDFKSRFQLAVHDVDSMSAATKMALLRDSLKGGAADAMQGYGLDPAKYAEFWDALNEKYDENYTLACHYLTSFFSLKKLPSTAREADLSRLSNETKGLIRKITEVKYKVENWDLIIVHALQQRLNDKYSGKWDEFRKKNENPTIDLMTTFLDDQATTLRNQNRLSVTVPNEYATHPQPSTAGASGGGVAKEFQCGVCRGTDHQPESCRDFYPLIYRDRLETAKQNNMCHNCLKRGHHKKNCWLERRCDERICQAKEDACHHPLLCAIKNRTERVHTVQYAPRDNQGHSRGSYRDSHRDSHRDSSRGSSNRS